MPTGLNAKEENVMKKFLSLLFVVIVLTVALTLSACISDTPATTTPTNQNPPIDADECNHSPVIDWSVEPTCTETGLTKGKHCWKCGEAIVPQEEIPALGHNIEIVVPATDPTCEEPGYTEGWECINGCGLHAKPEEIEPLGHIEVIDEKVPATCTSTGLREGRHCSVCGKETVPQTVIPMKSHTEVVDQALEATCTSTGLTEGKHCSVCATVIVEQTVIPALEHNYDSIVTKPTCTDQGYTTYTCGCGDSYVGDYIDATGHSFGDWVIVKEATVMGEGLKERNCECGKKETEVIPIRASKGLEFALNADGNSYYVKSNGNCTDTEIIIPGIYNGKEVTGIGNNAFKDCYLIINIIIPDTVTYIGDYAFSGCVALINLTLSNNITSMGNNAFENCQSLERVELPESLTGIGDSAFRGCISLIEINIPNGVTSINNNTFYGCTSLVTVVIPNSVTVIGDNAFNGCIVLINITLGNGITRIGSSAFENCQSLTNVTLPESLTYIGEAAFRGCILLIKINIPNGVVNINNYTFSGCISLATITIPDSVVMLGNGVFYNCLVLININYSGTVNQWQSISKDDNWNSGTEDYIINAEHAVISKDGTVSHSPSKGLEFALNDDGQSYSVIGIGTCTDTDIVIPNTYEGLPVTIIAENAFQNCTSIVSVMIPNSVTSIEVRAFENCLRLTNISIPNSVISIGTLAFSNCTRLQYNVYESVCYLGNENNLYFAAIMPESSSITLCKIHSDTVVIADSAFYSSLLKTVVIGDSVQIIGKWAFAYSYSLTNLTLGNSVKIISNRAFQMCDKLTGVRITDSVEIIEDAAFANCTSLRGVTLGNSVRFIDNGAFYDCPSLKYKEYNNGYYLGTIDNPYYALMKSKNMDITSSIIANTTKIIVDYTYSYCTKLKEIIVPDSVIYMGKYVFNGCSSLTIYCEAESQPSEWNVNWNNSNRPVVWGYKK